jgi:thymidylate synthase
MSYAHIYAESVENADELLKREPYAFPRMVLNPAITKLEDFRPEDFMIQDYIAHPPMRMDGLAV